MPKLVQLTLLLSFWSFACNSVGEFKNADKPLTDLVKELRLENQSFSILIEKRAYRLSMLVNGEIIKQYPVVFGPNAIDDKLMQGDGCTPEGKLKIQSKYPHKSWAKFLWLDYPNKKSWEKHKQAKADGKIPQDAKIGGEIGIHGVPEGYDHAIDQKQNWTLGCISLTRPAINEIYQYVKAGTIVEIRK